MKLLKNIIALTTLFAAATSFAKSPYTPDYYEDEGALLFKVRGSYSNSDSDFKKFELRNAGVEKPREFSKHGYGFDTATTYFFTDHIATELSLGLHYLKAKNAEVLQAAKAFGDGTSSAGKNNDIYWIPLSATMQYHIAPFGGLRPYIGGGYHGSYMYTRSKAFKVATTHGAVIQAGIDFIAKDDTIITFDVRKYMLESKLTFRRNFLFPNNPNANDLRGKVDWSPIIVSVGIGFKF